MGHANLLSKLVQVAIVALMCAGGSQAAATAMFAVEGKAVQIKDGKVELKSKSGISRVVLKKLPKKVRDAVVKAVAKKKEIRLMVTPAMLAKK